MSFLGDAKKSKKKKKKKKKRDREEETEVRKEVSSEVCDSAVDNDDDDDEYTDMTAAEIAASKRKRMRESEEIKQVAGKSHRERVDEFNEKLGKLTEHNDLPRISAAGNG